MPCRHSPWRRLGCVCIGTACIDLKALKVAMTPDYPYGYEKNVEHLASSREVSPNKAKKEKDPKVGV